MRLRKDLYSSRSLPGMLSDYPVRGKIWKKDGTNARHATSGASTKCVKSGHFRGCRHVRLNKSSHWRLNRNYRRTKCWLTLVRSFLEFLCAKRLSVHRVTFLSPHMQMGFVSYKYRLVAKSHVHSVSCRVVLVLIFCHIVTREPYNLRLPGWGRNKSGTIANVVKHSTNEMVTLHTTWDKLRANIHGIVIGWYMSHEGLSHCYWFMHGMVANGVWLLLESRFRSLGVMYHRHIVPINVGRSRDTYFHHS
jgi:hypothetical protein